MSDASDQNLSLRVGVLENNVVVGFRQVTEQITALTKTVSEIAARPSNIAWREIAMTAGAFLALFAYFDRYVESKTQSAIALYDSKRIGEAAVTQYRVSEVEKSVRLIAPIAGALVLGKKD